jgi:hypothetical protein
MPLHHFLKQVQTLLIQTIAPPFKDMFELVHNMPQLLQTIASLFQSKTL